MANSKAKERMDALKSNPSAKQVLMDYYAERLRELESQFYKTSKDMFDVHKGRCVELRHILDELER